MFLERFVKELNVLSLLCVFQRVPLLRTTDEFKEIEALFCKTMKGFDIIKIERIQNKALWEVFQWYVYNSHQSI